MCEFVCMTKCLCMCGVVGVEQDLKKLNQSPNSLTQGDHLHAMGTGAWVASYRELIIFSTVPSGELSFGSYLPVGRVRFGRGRAV